MAKMTKMPNTADMTEMTEATKSKRSEMEVVLTVLLSIACVIALALGVELAAQPYHPTKETSAEAFSNVKDRIETVNTRELCIAKAMFEQAIEEGGHRVDDSFVQIWSDDGLETISFHWKCGDQYYRTEVRGANYYPFREAEYIQGWYRSGSIKSVTYQNGYLFVDSDIEV